MNFPWVLCYVMYELLNFPPGHSILTAWGQGAHRSDEWGERIWQGPDSFFFLQMQQKRSWNFASTANNLPIISS